MAEKAAAGRRDRKGGRKDGYSRDRWRGKSEIERKKENRKETTLCVGTEEFF